jgi:hypothetical protein
MNSFLLLALLACAVCAKAADLGAASSYAVLAGSTITSTDAAGTTVTGNMGVYPGTAVTGFAEVDGGPGIHNGILDAANGAALAAQNALTVAYNNAAGLAAIADYTNQDLGGMCVCVCVCGCV